VISFFMPLILCATVVVSVGIGVLAAYAAVIGILYTFGRKPQPQPSPKNPRPVLLSKTAHAGGD
jgi:uncharacterized membrane protein